MKSLLEEVLPEKLKKIHTLTISMLVIRPNSKRFILPRVLTFSKWYPNQRISNVSVTSQGKQENRRWPKSTVASEKNIWSRPKQNGPGTTKDLQWRRQLYGLLFATTLWRKRENRPVTTFSLVLSFSKVRVGTVVMIKKIIFLQKETQKICERATI